MMASRREAEVIQEDFEMYTILGLVVFTSYFISWGIDVYKSCQKRSRKKKQGQQQHQQNINIKIKKNTTRKNNNNNKNKNKNNKKEENIN